CHGQYSGFSYQPETIWIRQLHTSEASPQYVRYPVVLGENLVDKCVIRGQQIENAAFLTHDGVEEQLQLPAHRISERLGVIGKQQCVRDSVVEPAQTQPLAGEVRRQRFRSRICEHSFHLLFEDCRLLELPLCCEIDKLLVRNAAPQKIGEAGRQLEIGDAITVTGRNI